METLQNKEIVLGDNNIMTVDILTQYPTGKFRFVVKTKLGYTVCDATSFDNSRLMKYPEAIIGGYKRGTLQTVQFCPEGSTFYLTVFSRVGTKVKLIDESILADLTVGTINQLYYNTNLYDQMQYQKVNAKTWEDKAYIMNKEKELV